MGAVETTIREQASSQASQPSEEIVRTEKVRFVVPEATENDVDSTDGQKEEKPTPNSLPAAEINRVVTSGSDKDNKDSTLTATAVDTREKNSPTPSVTAAPAVTSTTTPSNTSATSVTSTSSAKPSATPTETSGPASLSAPAAAAVTTKASLVDRLLSRSPKPEAKTPKTPANSTPSKPMNKARSNIWQNVVDGSLLGTKLFTHAAVYDQLTGEQLACSSKEFAIPKEEAVHLAKATHQPGRLAATGISVAGQAFNYSHGELGTALYGSDPMNKHRGIVIEAGDVYMIVAIFEENGETAKKNLKEMISHFKEHYSF